MGQLGIAVALFVAAALMACLGVYLISGIAAALLMASGITALAAFIAFGIWVETQP